MKLPFALSFSLFALLCFILLPSSARAADTYDCTEGCYIITCNESVCVAWFCDSRGCRMMNGWPREQAEGPQANGRKGKPAKPAVEVEVAYAKVCPEGKDCEVYELNATQALHLGSFDNVQDVLKYRDDMREQDARPR